MTKEVKILIAITLGTLLLIVGGAFLLSGEKTSTSSKTSVNSDLLLRNDSHSQGPADAKVTIVEFGDFQCPSCAQSFPVLKQIVESYNQKIRFVFRNFPLPQHKNALIAAEAAEAAGEQSKYWDMFDLLYEKQNEWAEESKALEIFTGYAKDIGLDTDKFESEVIDKKYSDWINQDINDATSLGVNSTPTIFINNIKYQGVITVEELKQAIDPLLSQ